MSSSDPEDMRPASASWKLAALAILALATALRVSTLGFGLDLGDPSKTIHNIQVDEREMVDQEVQLLAGDWHPGKFLARGTAPFYLAGVVNALVVGVASLVSGDGWDATLAVLRTNPSLIFYVHRVLVALSGVLTVFVLMRLCRREVGPRCGLIAGLLLATAHLHVHMSNVATVDVPWVLFATLALERCLMAMRDPRRANFLMAGLWIGLAGSTKYPGALVGAMLLAAYVASRRSATRAGVAAPSWRLVAGGVAFSIATFLAFSPRLLIWPEEYVAAVQYQADSLQMFDRASAYVHVFVAHVRDSLGIGLGETVLAAILYGYLVALRRGGALRRVALLALFFIPTTMIAQTPAPRFAMGFLVAMVPVAAIGIDDLVRNRSRLVRVLVVAIAVAPGLVRSVSYGLVLRAQDTRLEMLAELDERSLAPEDIIAVGHRGLPELPMRMPRRFVSLLREMRHGRMTGADVIADPPDYLLRDLCSGEPEELVWDPFRALVEAEYDEVFRADGRIERLEGRFPSAYYLLPRTFVPFAAPWKTTRPGPGLVLYRRRSID